MINVFYKTINGVKYENFLLYNGNQYIVTDTYGTIYAYTKNINRGEQFITYDLIISDGMSNYAKKINEEILKHETKYDKSKKVIQHCYIQEQGETYLPCNLVIDIKER